MQARAALAIALRMATPLTFAHVVGSLRTLLILTGALTLAAWLWLATIATVNYGGSKITFVLFVAGFSVALALAIPRPRLYGYSFLAGFMFLGFCAKLVAYLAFNLPLIEPTGSFDGTGPAWDAALLPAVVGALAAIAVRTSHLLLRTRPNATPVVEPPRWYIQARLWVLAATLALVALLAAVNLAAGFYQIGIRPRLVLPAHLNVPLSWLLSTAMAMWVAAIVGWELSLGRIAARFVLLLPLYEALLSASILSRATYLLRALAYSLVVLDFPRLFDVRLTRLAQVGLATLVAVGFVLSIASVSALRVLTYPARILPPTPAQTEVPSTPVVPGIEVPPAAEALLRESQPVAREISTMLVGRWIGIEGTMVVSSYPGVSVDLFRATLVEDPSAGTSALYQRIAGASYATDSSFVFGTTPGVIGVLYYSGSFAIVFLGMLFLVAFLVVFEIATARSIRNSFVVALTGQTLANAIAQMNFPYLFLVLAVQLWLTLMVLAVIASGSIAGTRRVARQPARA